MSEKSTSPHFAPTSPRELAKSHLTSPHSLPPYRGEVGSRDGAEKKTLIQADLWGEVEASIKKPVDNFYRSPSGEDFPSYRLDEYANRDRCWKCKSAVWVALCRTGFRTELDPEIVTPAQDLDFYLSRRRTYEVYKLGDRFMIQMRTAAMILGDSNRPALPQHKCNQDNIRKDCPEPWDTPTPQPTETTQEVPF